MALEEVKTLRKLIKGRIPTVSVRNSRGTAWGWVDIAGSGEDGKFTDVERQGLKDMGLCPVGNFCSIAPQDRKYWIEKLSS